MRTLRSLLSTQQMFVVICGSCEDTRCGGSSGQCCYYVLAQRCGPGCWQSSPPHQRWGEGPAPERRDENDGVATTALVTYNHIGTPLHVTSENIWLWLVCYNNKGNTFNLKLTTKKKGLLLNHIRMWLLVLFILISEKNSVSASFKYFSEHKCWFCFKGDRSFNIYL